MYLTRKKISTEEISKFKSDYEAHRTVCSMLPDAKGKHLFSMKGDEVLILSDEKPEGENLQTKEIPADFVNKGRVYRFKIKVNAVVTKEGRRIPLAGEKQIKEWFDKRVGSWGVALGEFFFGRTVKNSCYKGSNKITIQSSEVSGMIKVEDAEAFKKVFEEGVGKARRLGYGMFELVNA